MASSSEASSEAYIISTSNNSTTTKHHHPIKSNDSKSNDSNDFPIVGHAGNCAINLYGLPRSFKDYVLPSLIKNVIKINAKYQCDYYVHYYKINKEYSGRSGQGGNINFKEILLLKNAVELNVDNKNNRF